MISRVVVNLLKKTHSGLPLWDIMGISMDIIYEYHVVGKCWEAQFEAPWLPDHAC